jgi:imidazole glycerol-phosphate synthase subunit HisH
VPLLGLCLGMQLLASHSDEGGATTGLGLVPGAVSKIRPSAGLRVPHVGWNEVELRRDSRLFADVPPRADFYFVHSYHLIPVDDEDVVATTDYGSPLVAAVERGSVWGVQFHPEKSQRAGFSLLRAFLDISHVGSPAPTFATPRRRSTC